MPVDAGRPTDLGHAMVALLVGLNVLAILMAVAMPVWSQLARREKEAELVFRGEQYKRAIGLYQRRSGPGTLPPSIDVLVNQRFLRKAYKDPVTGEDFVLLRQGQVLPGQTGPAGRGSQAAGRGAATGQGPQPSAAQGVGGIVGVVSASREESLRLYNGRNHYNEWEFVFVVQAEAPVLPGSGGRGGGRGEPAGGRGGAGGGRGQQQQGGGRGPQGMPFPPPDSRGPVGMPSPVPPGR
jgi:type II secretory pathway pseudopilin PulG